MSVISIHSDSEFNSKFNANKSKAVFVDFTASWCGPCQYIAPIFAELAGQYKGAVFLKVDVDECSGTSSSYGVRAMPTFMAFVNGQHKETLQGANESGLRAMVKKYGTTTATWSGSGQRLSDGPANASTSSSARPASSQQAAPVVSGPNPIIDTIVMINERLQGFGITPFTVQGFVIQPFHLLIAVLALFFMGPFGLICAAAIVFFTQNNQGSGSSGGQSTENPFHQPPSSFGGPREQPKPRGTSNSKPFLGAGQRLGGQ